MPSRTCVLSLACLLQAAAWVPQQARSAPPQPVSPAAEPGLSVELQRQWRACVPAAPGPGMVVLVARGDAVLVRDARGLANVELGVSLRPEHRMRIASITKQFASAGLLLLADQGRVELDDPLSKYLPTFPNGSGITLAQLLNHTSGVRSYTRIDEYMASSLHRRVGTADLIDVFDEQAAEFAPGADYAYNDSGYVLVGAVIEQVTGQPWHAWIDQALLAPLGLHRTRIDDVGAVIPLRVDGYAIDADGTTRRAMYLEMSQTHAAGALLSTADDLLRWNRALHGGRVLSDATYRRMVTPEGPATGKDPRFGYGFGIERTVIDGRDALQHSGHVPGFATWLVHVPEADLTVAVLRNATGHREGCVQEAARRLAAAALADRQHDNQPGRE